MTSIKKSPISEIVYERITQMLFDGVFPPGTPITRRDLAERLGVSPTPVGEAIARLVGEGVVEQEGRSGYRIKEFSYENLESLYAVRAGIESIAVRLCVERAKDEEIDEICQCFNEFRGVDSQSINLNKYMSSDQHFHRQIVRYCRNSYIINYNKSHEFLLRSYQKGLLRDPKDTIDEHWAIIDAITNRNADEAQQRMAEHHLATTLSIRRRFLSG